MSSNTIIHKHSSVITEGKPKLPTKEQLNYGELAINYSEGNETITIKNSSDNIVEFKSKDYFDSIIEDNEHVIAAAFNDVNNKIGKINDSLKNKSNKIIIDNTKTGPIIEINENCLYKINLLEDTTFTIIRSDENYVSNYFILLNVQEPHLVFFPAEILWVKPLDLESNKLYYITITDNIAMYNVIDNPVID